MHHVYRINTSSITAIDLTYVLESALGIWRLVTVAV